MLAEPQQGDTRHFGGFIRSSTGKAMECLCLAVLTLQARLQTLN